jgi:hypothetical protein
MLLKRKGEEQDSGFGIQDRQDQGTHANRLDRAGSVSSLACLNKGILFCTNQAGMLLKKKGRCGKSRDQAGMYVKIKEIRV